jgi:hypothetical protein
MEEFRVSRGGTEFGPYTEAELREYLASGNIVESDLVRSAEMKKWHRLKRVMPRLNKAAEEAALQAARMAALRNDLPSPPDIPWWLALILEVSTEFAFFVGWDIVQAVWLYRVQKNSRALWYYGAAVVLLLANVQALYSGMTHFKLMGLVGSTRSTVLIAAVVVVRIFGHFSMRKSLLEHFNVVEPVGLRLRWFWTLVFGGLYFQYHFNRINEIKRARAGLAVKA